MKMSPSKVLLIQKVIGDDEQDDLDELDYVNSERNIRWHHNRVDWEQHVIKLLHEKRFNNEYKMSYEAFYNLTDILSPCLQRQEYNSRSISPVSVEVIIGLGLRFLGGGNVSDIRHVFGTSRAEAYHSIECFINAINSMTAFDIKLPSTARELEDIRQGFVVKSSNGLMEGCVGAIDGYFQPITCPRNTTNSNSYYSGHYESHGLNCHA